MNKTIEMLKNTKVVKPDYSDRFEEDRQREIKKTLKRRKLK